MLLMAQCSYKSLIYIITNQPFLFSFLSYPQLQLIPIDFTIGIV